METLRLTEQDLERTVELLKNNEVVCFATETVYGIGVIANDEEAYKKLVASKRRPPAKPFSLMCSSLEEAYRFCHVNKAAKAVMEAFMPGEITVLVNVNEGLPFWISLGTPTIGIRVPDSKYVQTLIAKVGYPCLVTSANHSGEPTSTSYEETLKTFDGEVAGVVKGECTSKKASTIVDLTKDETISLIREGPIPFEDIKKVWEANK